MSDIGFATVGLRRLMGATAAAQEARQFSIEAQPLRGALSQLAQQSGLNMAVPATRTAGVTSTAVNGRMTPQQALAALSAGTGLSLWIVDGTITLTPPKTGNVGADGSVVLDPITIRTGGAATEGSNSYAAGAASIARGTESLREVPQAVTVVTRKTLEDQNLTSMSEVMAKTPVIVANREATSAPTYYSRGFKINNYQVDALGTSYDSSFRPDFDMAIYDRVEVLRGAEGLFSGTGEPGGSVNLARKRPTGRVQSSIALSYGSWQNHRIEADIGGPLTRYGALCGRLAGAWQDRDFFYSPGDEKRKVLYGILEYDLTPSTTVSAGISYQNQRGNKWFLGLPTYDDYGLVDLGRDVALTPDWTFADHAISEVFAGVEHQFGSDWTLRFNAMRQKYDSETLQMTLDGPVDRETGRFGEGMVGSLYEKTGNHSKAVDLSLNGRFHIWGRDHKLLVGTAWRDSNAHQLDYVIDQADFPDDITIWNFHELSFVRPAVLGPRTH
ncbi:TonB-dependent receptor plug domain-containing protein [Paracoccus sp. SSJ]|uniref:TonB-dependent siderophore receptor n=1 Tax=Paracoccus sp. SSJ TaxID=3050636 RepID=UPI002550961A|nr:TonB-dependent receptor plug domain-containing protein [Paracoccus sp. SSJ]MDK8873217.1 TonB-dependent receptor plug domain-containing protein [Paracoccus sp. SSJ]